MDRNSLAQIARQDIERFMSSNDEILFNERDLQMHLAKYLSLSNHYDDVDLEYYVPHNKLMNYIWDSELRLDIVVSRGDEYLPIELKYKTKKSRNDNITIRRFEEVFNDVDILKNQGAQDLGCYDLWKDVRRLEIVRNRFPVVKSGLAVFATNDPFYWKGCSNNESAYYQFNLNEGMHSRSKYWSKDVTVMDSRPGFDLDGEYEINWKPVAYGGINFKYFIIKI